MNPNKPSDFKELTDAVTASYEKLEVFRRKRKEIISLFAGDHYSDNAEMKKIYLNAVSLALGIFVRQLAVRAPTALVATPYPELRHLAKSFQLACVELSREVKLGRLLKRVAADSLMSPLSCVKIALEGKGQTDAYGEPVDVTEPFIKVVSFDDYVRDMSARSAESPAFEGNKYVMPLDKAAIEFPKIEEFEIKSSEINVQNSTGEDRAEAISHTGGIGEKSLKKMVELWDIWLRDENLLVTYAVDKPEKPLRVIEFDGPSGGPYRSLWYNEVPDNAMPLPPFAMLRNLAELIDSLFRRLAFQAKNQKRCPVFKSEEDVLRFNKAHDGDALWTEDGSEPKTVTNDGIDQASLAFLIQAKDIFTWYAGNLDSIGGLAPIADTAKQESMLAQSASAQISSMQDDISDFAEDLYRTLAWYEWTDPIRVRELQKPVKNTDVTIPVLWSPETRSGNFIDFNFSIIPQSMREDNPAAKIQKLNNVLQQTIMPLTPILEQQGLGIDVSRLIQVIADYSNLPELEGIIVPLSQQQQQAGPRPAGNPSPQIVQPAQTTRRYEHVSRVGATRTGKDMALTQLLLGGNVQDKEGAAVFRGVS